MKKLLALTAVLSLTACATQTFEFAPTKEAATYDKAQHFFVNGIAQKQEINAAQICGGANKIAKVETETTFFNGLLSNVTYGLYAPRQIRVYCK